jgi:hypothetical protein
MKILSIVLVVLLSASALMALLSPYLVLRTGKLDAGDVSQARRHLVGSAIVVVVAVAATLGFSFSAQAGNFVAIIIAFFCTGALALYSFRFQPKLLALPVGMLTMIGLLLMTLYMGLGLVFAGNSPVTVELGDGLYCRSTAYGFVTSDSGEDIYVYKRVLFVDHELHHEMRSVIYPNESRTVPTFLESAVRRCDAAVKQKRSSAVQ